MTDTTDLPRGWAVGTLGDLVTHIETGKSPRCDTRPASDAEWGVIKVSAMTYGQFNPAENKALLPGADFDAGHEIRAGDVLVSRANTVAYVGAAVLVPDGVRPGLLLSDKSLRLVPAPGVDPKWLVHALRSDLARRQIEQVATGTKDSMRNISQDKLRAVALAVPPANEQQRVVAALEEHLSDVDREVADLTGLDRHLQRLEEVVIRAAVLGRLIPGVTGSVPATAHLAEALDDIPEPDTPDLPVLPARWTWTTLGALCDVTGGVTKDAKKQSDPSYVEVPYLRVANVQKGHLDLTEVTRIRVPQAKAEALRLLPGDVLFNEGGDRDKLGRGWVWEGQVPNCIHQNHVFRGRIRGGVLDPRLLSWHGNTFGRRWFEAAGKQTTNLASLSMTNLKRLPVPVPPLEDQAAIVAEVQRRLSIIRGTRDDIAAIRRKTQLLRRSLVHQAFNGGLVAQDPSDEPGELLLKRIAEDRATTAPTVRRRRARTAFAAVPVEEFA
jgi:type I restriction enzyme S subunit